MKKINLLTALLLAGLILGAQSKTESDAFRSYANKFFRFWTKSYYVNSFGEQTNNAFKRKTVYGTFSSSYASYEECKYRLFVDPDQFRIDVFEYGSDPADFSVKKMNVIIKSHFGIIKTFTFRVYRNSLIYDDPYRKTDLFTFFGSRGTFKFYFKEESNIPWEYRFTLHL